MNKINNKSRLKYAESMEYDIPIKWYRFAPETLKHMSPSNETQFFVSNKNIIQPCWIKMNENFAIKHYQILKIWNNITKPCIRQKATNVSAEKVRCCSFAAWWKVVLQHFDPKQFLQSLWTFWLKLQSPHSSVTDKKFNRWFWPFCGDHFLYFFPLETVVL